MLQMYMRTEKSTRFISASRGMGPTCVAGIG